MVLKQMFIIFQFIGINIIKDLNLTKKIFLIMKIILVRL